MDEIQLSSDLNVITAEINSYKQVAGQSIFEIGKRLKHVKENNLAHGEWGRWLESINLSRGQATKFITVFDELGSNDSTWNNLGTQALYLIATMPEGEREKEHTLSSGETKTPDEMTVRELQETKKKLKQSQQQLEQAQKSEEIALKKLEEVEGREPEVIEKEVIKEVIPEHIKKQIQEKDKVLQSAREEMESMQSEIDKLERLTTGMDEEAKKEKEVKLLMLDASKSVLKTKIKIDEFLQEVAVTPYRRGAIAASSQAAKGKLAEGVEELKKFIEEMELSLNATIEHH
ncbi:DUF3102 domain-containing protein [Oceanobacillus indicireducens]|uniref:DUF3102 domain-containing protein n=1 Tax=Oceanobacillus indicireducens TaxID=1004261 RepID=A0A917Y569_9BACI|nr:DUF3102 domain-containing protein [Oceanobacillus indicireducens]GGN66300.1 hypothetical protein GCM10007971_36110 [Oceanobacillus indicireducens]